MSSLSLTSVDSCSTDLIPTLFKWYHQKTVDIEELIKKLYTHYSHGCNQAYPKWGVANEFAAKVYYCLDKLKKDLKSQHLISDFWDPTLVELEDELAIKIMSLAEKQKGKIEERKLPSSVEEYLIVLFNLNLNLSANPNFLLDIKANLLCQELKKIPDLLAKIGLAILSPDDLGQTDLQNFIKRKREKYTRITKLSHALQIIRARGGGLTDIIRYIPDYLFGQVKFDQLNLYILSEKRRTEILNQFGTGLFIWLLVNRGLAKPEDFCVLENSVFEKITEDSLKIRGFKDDNDC